MKGCMKGLGRRPIIAGFSLFFGVLFPFWSQGSSSMSTRTNEDHWTVFSEVCPSNFPNVVLFRLRRFKGREKDQLFVCYCLNKHKDDNHLDQPDHKSWGRWRKLEEHGTCGFSSLSIISTQLERMLNWNVILDPGDALFKAPPGALK